MYLGVDMGWGSVGAAAGIWYVFCRHSRSHWPVFCCYPAFSLVGYVLFSCISTDHDLAHVSWVGSVVRKILHSISYPQIKLGSVNILCGLWSDLSHV